MTGRRQRIRRRPLAGYLIAGALTGLAPLAAAMPALGNGVPAAGAALGISARVVAPGGGTGPVRMPPADLAARRAAPDAPAGFGHQIKGGAQGGWQGTGQMLVLSQRGSAKSSPPMRPFAPLPAGVRVTSINWRIETGRPLPSQVVLALCMPGKCVYLDGLAGRSDAMAGQPADNPVTLLIQVAGRGVINQPLIVNRYQVLVNYQGDIKR
ncbi:flagellar protein FlhE [Sodalis sp. RH19]|uniref:flagellar protein FlhE n=1 Tax=Sodalis sp. RH19 TaxID=3394334 RepID=UPI0039B4D625